MQVFHAKMNTGGKSLPEPMMTHCQLDPCEQKYIEVKKKIVWRRWIWNHPLQVIGLYVQAALNVLSYCGGHYINNSLDKLITDTDIQAFTLPLNNTWPQYKCQYRSLLHPWVPHLIINRSLQTRNLNVSQPQFYCCRSRRHSIMWWNSAVKWCTKSGWWHSVTG